VDYLAQSNVSIRVAGVTFSGDRSIMTLPLLSTIEPSGPAEACNAWDEGSPGSEQRNSARFTLLIRAAKLIAGSDEFLVVVRDVSSDGLKVRTFHPLPDQGDFAIELANGERHLVDKVWEDGELKGFRFQDPVALEQLLADGPRGKRRRPVRVRLNVPVAIFAGDRRCTGVFVDLSQNGACMASDEHFALDQRVRIECCGLPELTGRVRWRRAPLYGLSFEQTFRLDELARITAQLTATQS
jgi:hypothetical protein